MFLLEAQIGEEIKNLRVEFKLTKEKLAKLSQINVKTLRKIEKGKRTEKIETIIKINHALKKNFNVDLFKSCFKRILVILKLNVNKLLDNLFVSD